MKYGVFAINKCYRLRLHICCIFSSCVGRYGIYMWALSINVTDCVFTYATYLVAVLTAMQHTCVCYLQGRRSS